MSAPTSFPPIPVPIPPPPPPRQPPQVPAFVDPNAPVLPPPSFTAPEGTYKLGENIIVPSIINPPPPPTMQQTQAAFGSINPAMAVAGMSGISPAVFGVSSMGPVAPGGPVAGPAYGQGNGSLGVPNPWPIRATVVTMLITGKNGFGNDTTQGGALSGMGGFLGRGGKKQSEQQQSQASQSQRQQGQEAQDQSSESSDDDDSTDKNGNAHGGGATKHKGSRRPKNNLRSSNSSFITRVTTNELFNKLVSSPPHLDPSVFASSQFSECPPRGTNPAPTHWVFLNSGRTLVWALADPKGKLKEPLMRLWFSANVTCHAMCEQTKVAPGQNGERLDLAVGFTTGDILWIDPIVGKYSRLNKGGVIHAVPVIELRWHPKDHTLIYALFADGNIFVFSTEREDPPWIVTTLPSPWSAGLSESLDQATSASEDHASNQPTASGDAAPFNLSEPVELQLERQKARRAQTMYAWRNEEQVVDKKVLDKQGTGALSWAGRNPVAVWKVGVQNIRHIEIAPDGQMLGIASEDGTVKVVDTDSAKLIDVYSGYFGAMTTLVWSPDGYYLLAGGQDDLITIFAPLEGRVVARCQGHSSFVTCIAFDRKMSNTRGYRFGSVAEDGKLLFWDFNAASLQRPKHATSTHTNHTSAAHRRVSMGSMVSIQHRGSLGGGGGGQEALNGGLNDEPVYHLAPPRSEVAMLQPVMTKLIEPCLLNSIHFMQETVMTVSRAGGVKFWIRPPDLRRMLRNKRKEAEARS